MIIKVLLIVGIAVAALVALRGSGSAMNLALRRLGAVAFVLLAGIAVALPDSVTWVAERVGVAQGSNLVLYALVLAFLFVSIGVHQRIQRLENRLSVLTRELAIRTATGPTRAAFEDPDVATVQHDVHG